jgi:hypothetical protein
VLQRAAPEHAFPALPLLVGLVAPLLADSPVDWSRRSLDLGSNKIESVADVTWPSSLGYVSLLACCATKGSARARLPLPLLVGLVAPLLADSPVDWSRRRLALYNNQIESVTNMTWPSSLGYVSLLACGATEAASEHAFPALPLLVGLVAPLLADSPVDGSRRSLDLGSNQIKSVADVTWPSSLGYVSLLACSATKGSARARLPLPLLVGLVAPLLADSPVDWSRRYLGLEFNQIESVADVTWPSSLGYVSLLACGATEAASEHAFPALPLLVGLVAPLLADSPSIGLTGSCTSVATKSRAWLT